MKNANRLEKFWRDLILTMPFAEDLNGAVITYCPEVPMLVLNHAAAANVKEDEAENLIRRVTEYFFSRGFPYACFRITPLTYPKSFPSLLESHGFEKKSDESVMVFKGERLEDMLNPEVKIEEISESEMDTYCNVIMKIFEMPVVWKEGMNRLFLENIGKGWRFYSAYVEGRTVGTCALVSLAQTGGIFNVGTLEEYRKCGIGTTLTARALTDSVKEGNTLHTLQTDKGGHAEWLYQKMGFEIDHTFSFYVKSFKMKD